MEVDEYCISAEDIEDAKLALLAEYDPFHKTRWFLDQIAQHAEVPEYCGIPMPVDGERLIVEPRNPAAAFFKEHADKFDEANTSAEDKELDANSVMVNSFYSRKKKCEVVIWREYGKLQWALMPRVHHLKQDLSTMACSPVWSLEAEAKAQQLLAGLVTHYQMRCYLLTGMFIESSKRSGVMYIFRRLRPTVAARGERILTALCMHPIGYYDGTWAGSMVPTDDVVAHLLLMRSDEHMFWRRSNQHPAWSNLAGL